MSANEKKKNVLRDLFISVAKAEMTGSEESGLNAFARAMKNGASEAEIDWLVDASNEDIVRVLGQEFIPDSLKNEMKDYDSLLVEMKKEARFKGLYPSS